AEIFLEPGIFILMNRLVGINGATHNALSGTACTLDRDYVAQLGLDFYLQSSASLSKLAGCTIRMNVLFMANQKTLASHSSESTSANSPSACVPVSSLANKGTWSRGRSPVRLRR